MSIPFLYDAGPHLAPGTGLGHGNSRIYGQTLEFGSHTWENHCFEKSYLGRIDQDKER